MMILITYDVCTQDEGGSRRLRNVARLCMNYGQRVQYSVFECLVTPAQATYLEDSLKGMIDQKKDSIRIYHIGGDYASKVTHIGAKKPIDLNGTLIY